METNDRYDLKTGAGYDLPWGLFYYYEPHVYIVEAVLCWLGWSKFWLAGAIPEEPVA